MECLSDLAEELAKMELKPIATETAHYPFDTMIKQFLQIQDDLDEIGKWKHLYHVFSF